MYNKFTIYNKFPTCNEYIDACRTSVYKGAALKKKHTDLTAVFTRDWLEKKRISQFNNKINIEVTWIEKNRKRDPDNVYFGIKFVLDGLVKGGLLPNDTQEYIGKISHEILVEKNSQYGVILIFKEKEINDELAIV